MQKNRRIDILPASLAPIAVRREIAAASIDVSPTKFDDLVRDGSMPPARMIGSRRVWLLEELRARALDLPTADDPAEANPFDDL